MPRKAYLADLEAASNLSFSGISDISSIADGEFSFTLNFPSQGSPVKIIVLIPEVSDYPSSHDCMLFASDDIDVPAKIAAQIQTAPSLFGKSISQSLQTLSQHFTPKSLAPQTDSDGDSFIRDADEDEEEEDGGDYEYDANDSDADGENEDWALDEDELDFSMGFAQRAPPKGKIQASATPLTKSVARSDLITAKNAGFKVAQFGFTGSPDNPCFVSVSCRIAKLGISEEALEAWNLQRSQYLILLMYYPSGYKSLKELSSSDGGARNYVELKVGVSDTYKPKSFEEAMARFQNHAADRKYTVDNTSQNSAKEGFQDTFISRPINELLNGRLIIILKYRLGEALGWDAAEQLYNDRQGAIHPSAEHVNKSKKEADHVPYALPPIVVGDHMQDVIPEAKLSFPLIGMQFLLRHFVRCTEFCLVCFSKLDSELEAIKPYVCDRGLCLFQYMSLGFGPSIEPEILSQPYVVDLLISFCYSSAAATNLHDYPEGLGLSVPNPELTIQNWNPSPTNQYPHHYRDPQSSKTWTPTVPSDKAQTHKARFNMAELELLFDTKECPVKKGDWIVLNVPKSAKSWHCKIKDVVLFPTVKIANPIELKSAVVDPELAKSSLPDAIDTQGWQEIEFHIYERNFDMLGTQDRSKCIQMLLSLLPSIPEMKEYLMSKPGLTLANWTDRIPPAAVGILRWIIASNRSCIVQVDRPEIDGAAKKTEDRVQGMQEYLQFRFAMGAPDKEQRFINSIKEESATKPYQTLFAWHGSGLSNWHSIIRQGLHCKKVSHGRAYGDGCYHAKDFQTSSGYSGYSGYHGTSTWPQSQLHINHAIALSEIVNAPDKFTSSSPYYVVAQLDWIQTRYLFAKPGNAMTLPEDSKINMLDQDPNRKLTGPNNTQIMLPLTAVPKSRRPRSAEASSAPAPKKVKMTNGKSAKNPPEDNSDAIDFDDTASVETDDEDLVFLIQEERPPTPPPAEPRRTKVPTEPILSFTPATIADLPLLPSPPFATPSASKSLQRDFRTLMHTQDEHIKISTLHELGWWMDPEHISKTDNLYQWVVQLHSFPLSLPLAKDMKAAGIEGVVLELRFPAAYPHAPPFIRVVRPRFLPFSAGGGGHVTMGGSICMELLTNNGWSAVNSIESVLLQVRMAIMNTEPKPARLQQGGNYSVGEAVESFKRACKLHGWRIPEDLDRTAFAEGAGRS